MKLNLNPVQPYTPNLGQEGGPKLPDPPAKSDETLLPKEVLEFRKKVDMNSFKRIG